MSKKEKNKSNDDNQQSSKKKTGKEWTQEEMNKAVPMPLPELPEEESDKPTPKSK